MKRIIEYLEKSDIVGLTDEFIKSDILSKRSNASTFYR